MRHTGLSLATLLAHVVTVRPRKRWCYAGHPHLSGATEVARIDAAALGLVPFMVRWLERIGSRPEPE